MAILLDGTVVRDKILKKLSYESAMFSALHGMMPKLVTILVGDDPASHIYVGIKKKTCQRIGFASEGYEFDEDVPQKELTRLINGLNNDDTVHGILVQLPLPAHIDKYKVMDAIHPFKDVDGLNTFNVAKLRRRMDEKVLEPCTPKGVMTLFEEYNIPFRNKHIVIVNKSDIVGLPLADMIGQEKYSTTISLCDICTYNTGKLEKFVRSAEVLVSAVGKHDVIRPAWIHDDVIVVDVANIKVDDDSFAKGYRIVGDIYDQKKTNKAEFAEMMDRIYAITPVPGSIGPLTIASLMENTLKAAKMQRGNNK